MTQLQEKQARAFRDALGRFPTGVTVVGTVDAEGRPVGLTVNSFASVSLDPPLVLVCIGKASSCHDALIGGDVFTVNILGEEQREVAERFATEPSAARFRDVTWSPGPGGGPVLDGVSGWLACRREAVHDGGDHSILIGRVEALEVGDEPPLVFHRGEYATVSRRDRS